MKLPFAISVVLCLGAAPAAADGVVLDIGGTPGMEYRGECQVADRSRSIRKVEFDGHVPDSYAFGDDPVSCTVQKWDSAGRLRVALVVDNRVLLRSETAAAFNWVRVRTRGPWGAARAARGDQSRRRLFPPSDPPAVPVPTPAVPPDRIIVPPIRNPVPPLSSPLGN